MIHKKPRGGQLKQLGQPFKRPNKTGWWLRWTDPMTRKRIIKGFHNKGYADHYRSILYARLNSDVITGVIDVPFSEAVAEYLQTYDVRGLRPPAKVEARLTLDKFKESVGVLKTRAVTQKTVDRFIVSRLGSSASRWTINKDIGNLKAFVRWCQHRRYMADGISLVKVKVQWRIVKALTSEQIKAILAACESQAWQVRVLLSLCTGLRKNDLDGLAVASIDLKRMTIDTTSQKTGKFYVGRPLPKAISPILKEYLSGKAGKLFEDVNVRKQWDALRIRAKLPGITRQDFRRTFSTLIQRIGSIGSAQTLLEHSDSRVTGEFYTDIEIVLRWKVNQLPVKEWIDPAATSIDGG